LAEDEDFLRSLIFQGGFTVIVDGLNEAGSDVCSEVRTFLGSAAAVAIGTQSIGLSWPANVRVLEFQPLHPSQAEDFLRLQEVDAEQAKAFVAVALNEQQPAQDLEANRLVLSNPFELSVIAQMLKQGSLPNLLTLREQQYQEWRALGSARTAHWKFGA